MKTCSFDFDGVLHLDVDGIHPTDYYDDNPTPNNVMLKKLRQEALVNRIIIITARCSDSEELIWSFINLHELPVAEIHTTCDRPKFSLLDTMPDVIRHYDDNPDMYDTIVRDRRNGKYEFVFVANGRIADRVPPIEIG